MHHHICQNENTITLP